jgi:hypothetical protein
LKKARCLAWNVLELVSNDVAFASEVGERALVREGSNNCFTDSGGGLSESFIKKYKGVTERIPSEGQHPTQLSCSKNPNSHEWFAR